MATEPRSTTAPGVDGELMPQRQVLEDEIAAGADRSEECCDKQTEVEHRRASRGSPILTDLRTKRHGSGFAVPRLIARIATGNPRRGAVRIQGERLALGYAVSAETVRCYRRRAQRRPPSQSWRSLLANHRPQPWAADCFTVQTRSFKTLYVLFFITHARRRIVHFNVTAHPTAPWVWRQWLAATPWGQQPR